MSWTRAADYFPVPIRLTVCGLPPPSSLTEIIAVSFPVSDGLNVTLMMQLARPANCVPQLSLFENDEASMPVIEILVIFRGRSPLFVSVMFLGALFVPTD